MIFKNSPQVTIFRWFAEHIWL